MSKISLGSNNPVVADFNLRYHYSCMVHTLQTKNTFSFKNNMLKKYKIGYLFITLILFNLILFHFLPKYRFHFLVIHHSGTDVGDYKSIKSEHKNIHGWNDAAYHLILSNGSKNIPLGYLEATSRYKNLTCSLATQDKTANRYGLNLCVIGNYDENVVPKKVQNALGIAINLIQKKYEISDNKIFFHRNFNATRCPGININKQKILKWKKKAENNPNNKILQQQKQIIDNASQSLNSIIYVIKIPIIMSLFIIVWYIVIMKIHHPTAPK